MGKILDKILRSIAARVSTILVDSEYFKDYVTDLKKTISKDSQIFENAKVYPPYIIIDSIIGEYTYVARNSNIRYTTIGKFCSIGPNLTCGWGIHPLDGISTSPMFYSTHKQNGITLSQIDKFEERKPISIGNDVFIGMNVTILDGVVIGDGAVIGAGSIVSKNIGDFAIAFGNPIIVHKYRFTEEQRIKLKAIKWWNFDFDQLRILEENFFDVDQFLNLINNISARK